MCDTDRRSPISEDELLRLLAKHHAPVTPPEEFEQGLWGELEAEFRRRHDHAQTYSTVNRFGRVTVFRLAFACAAAACVVAGWVVWSASRGASVAPKVNAIVPRPATSPPRREGLVLRDDSASFLTYHRALNESSQALNSLLDQEAKSNASPMRSLTDMDASRFLQTLEPVKENGHESRIMGSRACGRLV